MTPSNPLPDGKYKVHFGGPQMTCGTFSAGVMQIYGEEEGGQVKVNLYQNDGTFAGTSEGTSLIEVFWVPKLQEYDNYTSWEIEPMSGNIANVSQYVELT